MKTAVIPGLFDQGPRPMAPASLQKPSLVEKLAAHFQATPNTWLDGRELATIAGAYGWRTRTSDLRRAPFNMRIENRQRHAAGESFVISEYRFVPEAKV